MPAEVWPCSRRVSNDSATEINNAPWFSNSSNSSRSVRVPFTLWVSRPSFAVIITSTVPLAAVHNHTSRSLAPWTVAIARARSFLRVERNAQVRLLIGGIIYVANSLHAFKA